MEEAEARRFGTRLRNRPTRRLAVVYDTDGPRVRLGLLWFGAQVVALMAGLPLLVPLYAAVAGVAALQTARVWRTLGRHPDRLVAGVVAAAVPLAAAITTALLGLTLLGLAAAAYFVAAATSGGRSHPLVDAGYTVQCSLFAGLAAASVILVYRYEIGAAVALLLLVAAYETGDYLIGSGANNPYEGPVAGATAVLVVMFAIAALGVPPFEFPSTFWFAAMAAVLCPLGQLMASAILPTAATKAPALRRLDSLLVLAPVWAWTLGWYAVRQA